KRLLPGRWPPYPSLVGDSVARYTYPSSSSAENGPHTPTLPEYVAESFSQVSWPGSPERGTVWNVQSFFPVRTSNAMTSPLTFSLFGLVPPCVSAGPTTITPLETTGA